MSLTQEGAVTGLLSKKEIIGSDGELYDKDYNRVNPIYSTLPKYDLTNYMKTLSKEPSRWGAKYIFVK